MSESVAWDEIEAGGGNIDMRPPRPPKRKHSGFIARLLKIFR